MSSKSRINHILQKLMMLWVRVDILPRDLSAHSFGDKPVLYVLAARGLSDPLVLEYCTEKLKLPNPFSSLPIKNFKHHGLYSVASRNPLSDWILNSEKHSLMLEELLTALKNNPELDISVVPVSVFWGRPIVKQRHWLKVLFADSWEVAGRLRKFFTILVQGKNTTVIFSNPQSLRALSAEVSGIPERLNELLKAQLNQQREATFGPKVNHLNKIIHKVIHSPNTQLAITQQSEKTGKGEAAITKQAVGYCREIFSNCTQISQEIMKRLLNAFWNRYYSGIKVFNADALKQIALTHQLVYVPCHRSHVDYLLLSYVIFHEGLALPYIAAGNNLDMPIIGRLLRGGGAFFIRRSFKKNPLYATIMHEYIRELVDMGVPIEYFVEGGRSRTGRLLKPKLGMLSMTVEAWIKTQKKPIAFIPVYIGYEKLIEGNSYIGELYGEKKKKESLLSSIKSILTLKGQFGKVTTSFGKPIELENILQHNNKEWGQSEREIDNVELKQQNWFRTSVNQLAHQIMLEINAAAVVNPVNLIATTLLATPRQSIDQGDLISQCKFYRKLIVSQPMLESITLQDKVTEQEIKRIEQQGLIHIQQHELGNIVYLKPQHAVLMSYYRNNTLHTLIIPSLVACCFLHTRTLHKDKLLGIVSYVYPFLAAELHLPWSQQQLEQYVLQNIDFMVAQKVLKVSGDKLKRPDRSDHHFLLLTRLAHVAQPVLERYYMTFVVLWESGGKPLSESELEQRCHLVAQKISMLYGINSPDFFDRQLFRHFIDTLFRLNFIEHDENGHLVFQQTFEQINLEIRILLSLEVRSTILQLLNSNRTELEA
jgi:glycerol-3-phosphate O-acyltransferase